MTSPYPWTAIFCGPDGDISKFAQEGPVVEDYVTRLATYAVAIMGRSTYEFGYRFGMKPGENPYQHMETYVFSKTLDCPPDSDIAIVKGPIGQVLSDLKSSSSGAIYLCGGGEFAGALLSSDLIDVLRLKRAPVVLGSGVRLFGSLRCGRELICVSTKTYNGGYTFQEFQVKRSTSSSAA